MKNNNKGFMQAWLLAIILGFVVVAGGAYFLGKNLVDGSRNVVSSGYDQRQQTEQNHNSFAPVDPGSQANTNLVPMQQDQKVAVPTTQDRGPISTTLPTPYISGQQDWPPIIQFSKTPYSCIPGSGIGASGLSEKTEQKSINGKLYCIKSNSEGAAGSIYNTYTYMTAYQDGIKTTTFTLRYVQCVNYDEPQRTMCQRAQTIFNLDAIIDSLMR